MKLNKQYKATLFSTGLAGGFTLVELLIALVLGLLLVAGVGSVFLANQNAYRTNVALGAVQESARTSFEFLAREIRSAGANPCGTANVASVLQADGDAMLYGSGSKPIEGWDDAGTVAVLPDSGAGAPVANGGGAIRLAGARSTGLDLEDSTGRRTSINLKSSATGIDTGDILMLCDVDKATIFQATKTSDTAVEARATGGPPGNRTDCLNHPVPQPPGLSGAECLSFSPSSYLAIPTNYIWYVGENDAGGRSLYRYGRGQEATSKAVEIVRGVWELKATYHQDGGGAYVPAGSVGNWELVDAVRLELTVRESNQAVGASGAGTDNQFLERTFTSTVAMRNRLTNN